MALRLSIRAPVCRPTVVRASRRVAISRTPVNQRLAFVVRSGASEVGAKVETAIKDAEETCATSTTADCAVAWDTVEELTSELDKKKKAELANADPLEAYCKDVPEADECRVYED